MKAVFIYFRTYQHTNIRHKTTSGPKLGKALRHIMQETNTQASKSLHKAQGQARH